MTDLIQTSSLEKILPKNECDCAPIEHITVLHGEEASYQIAFKDNHKTEITVNIISDISESVTAYSVGCVPVMLPTFESAFDDPDYISTEPAIYPDILVPIENGKTEACGWYQSIWIKIDKNAPTGQHKITVELATAEEKKYCELSYEVLPIELPESDLIFTQWFHTDCISQYHNAPVWSEELWNLIEKYITTAVNNGINMILTPVFTPPLDTEIGGERPTVQLVKIEKNGEKYSFNFSLLERWVDLCSACGIKYFEIAHLFTQWGAKFTPKIIATENGEEKQIFGWDIAADDERYENFLSQFLPELITFFEKRDLLENTYFHISDEPSEEHAPDYLKAKKIAVKYLKNCHIIDALSDYDFYKKGIVELPVVAIDCINPFIGNVDELWGYYCCAQCSGVSNRFIAMPSSRNRFIALQMHKYKLKGFLQWGYNFYYTQYSKGMINPFLTNDSGGAFPAGEAFSVYPGKDGPLESLRLVVFHHALQDLAAIKLLESLIGYDETLKITESIAGNIVFDKCTSDPKVVLDTREAVNNKLKELLCK